MILMIKRQPILNYIIDSDRLFTVIIIRVKTPIEDRACFSPKVCGRPANFHDHNTNITHI